MKLDAVAQTAMGIALGGLVLAWLQSPAKAEPSPNPAPGPSSPPLRLPVPLPIPTPANPQPDAPEVVQAGHWYLITVTTAGAISDDQIAQRVQMPMPGATIGKWWRVNSNAFAFTLKPDYNVPRAALAPLLSGGNVSIQEVNSWDDGPS